MPRNRLGNRRGQSVIEFAMVGVPLIFVLISTFEMCRGMWIYHTLVQAVNAGARFAVVNGAGCSATPNTCKNSAGTISNTVGAITTAVADAGTGLVPAQMNVTLTAGGNSTTCNPLSTCTSNTATQWPPASSNTFGTVVKITGTYPFDSAIAMFWPGGHPMRFNSVTFSASAAQVIQF